MTETTLNILWTSGDVEVAKNMAFMYTLNAKIHGWFEDITFIIWGPSSKLLASNEDLQMQIKKFIDVGINVRACKACADSYHVSDTLENLGISVEYMGQPLTEMIKDSSQKLITF